MDWLAPIAGLILIATGIAYGVRSAWRLFRRGHKDQVWIFDDANRSALFLGTVMVTHALVRLVTLGATSETLIWALIALVLIPAPHFFYAMGRMAGIRQRAETRGARDTAP